MKESPHYSLRDLALASIRYFEGVNRSYPGKIWALGVETSKEFLQILNDPDIPEEDIFKFLEK